MLHRERRRPRTNELTAIQQRVEARSRRRHRRSRPLAACRDALRDAASRGLYDRGSGTGMAETSRYIEAIPRRMQRRDGARRARLPHRRRRRRLRRRVQDQRRPASSSSAPERVIDTPISEIAIIGAAAGRRAHGHAPIAEMQFIDFITCAYDMLVNFAATSATASAAPARSSCAARPAAACTAGRTTR